MDPLVIVFGLGVGILVGLTGMGGGTLMTPLLILVVGVKPVLAVGTDIGYAAVTKTVGGIKHLRQGTVDLTLSTYMGIGSVPAALAGVLTLQILANASGSHFDGIIIGALSGVLLLTGVATLARLLLTDASASEQHDFRPTRRNKIMATVIGAFVGFVLGVTSAGSGALIGVALIVVFRLVPTRVVGTDVFHASLLLWAAALAHAVAGNIDYALAGTLLLGSVPGVWIGSHLAVRVPTHSLRAILSVVLMGSGAGLLTKAGVNVPTPVLVAAPLAIMALAFGEPLRRRRRRTLPNGAAPAAAPGTV